MVGDSGGWLMEECGCRGLDEEAGMRMPVFASNSEYLEVGVLGSVELILG